MIIKGGDGGQFLAEGWPICAECQRPAMRLSWTTDPERQVVEFTIECHGETDTVEVSHLMLMQTAWASMLLATGGK